MAQTFSPLPATTSGPLFTLAFNQLSSLGDTTHASAAPSTHPGCCRDAQRSIGCFKHLLDRLANGSNLLANDSHNQWASIHTSLHLNPPGFSDYMLDPPHRRPCAEMARNVRRWDPG